MLAGHKRDVEASDQVPPSPRPGRRSDVVEVVTELGHEHCRVEWEDGEETLVHPGTSATIEGFHPDRRLVDP